MDGAGVLVEADGSAFSWSALEAGFCWLAEEEVEEEEDFLGGLEKTCTYEYMSAFCKAHE